jgi:isoquinoline 1-oxidoreductase alpha subunit
MPAYSITLNGKPVTFDADPAMPLLWVLRERLGFTGTKYGCGVGSCGACTVLRDGAPIRSCQVTAAEASGHAFTTIEGLAHGATLHPVQLAWLDEDVAQCGYCQPAAILTTVALLKAHADPTDAQVDDEFAGFVCRCGTWPRMRRAIRRAAQAAVSK